MTTYTIKRGEVNAKPNKTALRFVRSGAAWRVRFKLDQPGQLRAIIANGITVAHEPLPVPNTHIKLLGLYWSGWMVWQRMREAWRAAYRYQSMAKRHGLFSYRELGIEPFWYAIKKALRQYLAWTHGNSARVIAKWEERKAAHKGIPRMGENQRGVSLATYYYLQGRGAVTTGSPVAGQEIAWLPEDPDNPGWTVWGDVSMDVTDHFLHVAGHLWTLIPLSRRPWFFGLCKPHAANGPSSPHAPCDLTFEMERV